MENFDVGKNNEKYNGKTFVDFLEPMKIINTKVQRMRVADLKVITDAWQREEISYSKMVELINEHFGFSSSIDSEILTSQNKK